MRQNSHIETLWNNGGPFIGDDGAPHGRITVEKDWVLRTFSGGPTFPYSKGPVRYYQRADNGQIETEIPNVATIDIDRSLDQDAATCNITIHNTRMIASPINEFGQPGYFSPSRGKSAESQSRWGQTTNSWTDVLVPNALLRTYGGYGGRNKTISQAVADGNIIKTGVWMVDEVRVQTNGMMEIKCRDMAKLLIDQQIYPPFVRNDLYPLQYAKYIERELFQPAVQYGEHVLGTSDPLHFTPVGASYAFSTNDMFGTGNAPEFGHYPSEGRDVVLANYWLSRGHDAPTEFEFWEMDVAGAPVNAVTIYPFMGSYTVYISVMVGGVWQPLLGNIPYLGTDYANPDIAIPYVAQTAVPYEGSIVIPLPQTYSPAQRIRLSFTHLVKTDFLPKPYRAGIRAATAGNVGAGPVKKVFGIDSNGTSDGYWLSGSDGRVMVFGGVDKFGDMNGVGLLNPIVGIARTATNAGYWLVDSIGGVFTFGDAVFYGSAAGTATAPVVEIEAHPSGNGYWILSDDGGVFTYGAAGYHGSAVPTHVAPIVSMTSTVDGNGYWLIDRDGRSYAFGSAPYLGNIPVTNAPVTGMDRHPAGGYYAVAQDGGVFSFGGAPYYGSMAGRFLNDPISDVTVAPNGQGYWLVAEDGGVFTFGTVAFVGSGPGGFHTSNRQPGNYDDYISIIKDILLWSGFYLYDGGFTAGVYGNLESTGAWSEAPIPHENFDKKPPIDAIRTIKEIVGYIVYVDDEGAIHFHSPNWWESGNFLPNGTHVDTIPVIDEAKQLTSYGVSFNDQTARSQIIISTYDPTTYLDNTITTVLVPNTADLLRGMIKPAMWVNGLFTDPQEQKTMAELIALQVWFQQRQGQVSCIANPLIGINDQVRIFERQTGETYIHYIRGLSTHMDLDSGEYTMSVTCNWLGDSTVWAITPPS